MHLLSNPHHTKSTKLFGPLNFKKAYNYKDSKYAFSFGIHIISNHGQE